MTVVHRVIQFHWKKIRYDEIYVHMPDRGYSNNGVGISKKNSYNHSGSLGRAQFGLTISFGNISSPQSNNNKEKDTAATKC